MAIAVGGTEYVYGTCKYYTNTSSAMRYECRLVVGLDSQSVANNTSSLTLILQVRSTDSSYKTQSTQTSVINGSTVTSGGSFNMSSTNTWQTFGSRTQTVTHNADGSYSFPVSASFTTNATTSAWSLKSGTISGSVTLATIPRASSISCGSQTMGTPGTIIISRASSSFSHTITADFGDVSETITTKTTGTSVPWTPQPSWAAQIPNATSRTCTLTCITYSGSTEVGRKAISITLYVSDSLKPTLTSLTAARVDGTVPAAWATYVKGKSKVKLTINGAAGAQGSTIRSYSISGGGYSSGSASYTTDYLNTAGPITFTATVTDSRGRTSAAKTVSITVYDYTAPTITALSAFRSNSAGAADPTAGTYIRVTGSYSIATVNSKNSIATHTVYYRATGTSSWTSGGTLATGGTLTIGGGNITVANSYEVRYYIKDALGSAVERIVTINAASRSMNIKSNAAAFGQMSTGTEKLESAWPGFFKKSLTLRDAPETQLYMQPQGVANHAYLYANQDARMGLYDSVNGIVFRYAPDDMFYFQRRVTCVARADFSDNIYCKDAKIVDYGTANEGHYSKFYDGTLICRKSVSYTGAIKTPWGQMYETAPTISGGAWPHAFSVMPQISYAMRQGTSVALADWYSGTTTTAIGEFRLLRAAPADSGTWTVDIIGIGRWR